MSKLTGLSWLLAVLLIAKVAATVILVVMGNYRAARVTALQKAVALTSKTTPVLITITALVRALLLGDIEHVWIYGGLSVGVLCCVMTINRLRKAGRFYGVADILRSRYRVLGRNK